LQPVKLNCMNLDQIGSIKPTLFRTN
jgi:hypothetical protein